MVLIFVTETHDPFYPCAVVPGAVKEHYLACCWIVINVPLEVPLSCFAFGGFIQRHGTRSPGVHILGKPLNGTALAGSIATFKHDDDLLARVFGPVLQLQ